jgi:hypothetical protein
MFSVHTYNFRLSLLSAGLVISEFPPSIVDDVQLSNFAIEVVGKFDGCLELALSLSELD